MQKDLLKTASELPVQERIELAEALWESVVTEGNPPATPSSQIDELERRLQAHQESPNDTVPADQVFSEARKRISEGK